MKTKLAILGCGNMGSAIGIGLCKTTKSFALSLFDPDRKKAAALAQKTKGEAVSIFSDLKSCEYFLIACKPQQFAELAEELKPTLSKNVKIVSIMAGMATPTIQKKLGCKKLARVMPNTPALINEGAIAVRFFNMNAGEKKKVLQILKAVGEVHVVASDREIDLVTAGTGSGPAYIFEIARILIDQLSKMGLKRVVAEPLVKQMIKGSAALMRQSKDSPEALRNKVTSKGGTTEAALKVFKKEKLEKIFQKALTAAFKRGQALSK
ncbi:MAG: pyrroline-5-carboxylate reductase [Deltaproteobacteria bacterium]|nr:pyrroline-5-carboxylate reductase [Deltaproteobacteria bacterium]